MSADEVQNGTPGARRHRAFSPRRVWTIGRGTLTQLIRMKAFYFLGIFCLVLFGAAVFITRLSDAESALISLNATILGVIKVFVIIVSVVGTAVLLPKDVEDRTLYTILSKPVPRLEYLMGKLVGLLLLVGIALLIMDLLFSAVLHLQVSGLLGRVESDDARQAILAQGVRWGLHAAVLANFFEAVVLTSVTLLLSTIASSTLFTIISGFAVYLIGLGQSTAREFFIDGQFSGAFVKVVGAAVALVFPDFQMFDIADGVIAGVPVALAAMAKLAALTAFYLTIYLIISYLIFSEKEL